MKIEKEVRKEKKRKGKERKGRREGGRRKEERKECIEYLQKLNITYE